MSLIARPYVIAEAGVCHSDPNPEWRLRKAVEYVRSAALARSSAVKFQLFRQPSAETMFCWHDGDVQHLERWNNSALTLDQWQLVKSRADKDGIDLLFSCFEYEALPWLHRLEVKATKVASRAAATFPYPVAPTPWLISTGEGMPPEGIAKHKQSILLECESKYPSTARWQGKYPGFSDHSGDPGIAIRALEAGAKVVEVHFYIDPDDAGPDQRASLTVKGLRAVCERA